MTCVGVHIGSIYMVHGFPSNFFADTVEKVIDEQNHNSANRFQAVKTKTMG